MTYEKQNFKDGEVLKAEHLNHIEEGIGQLSDSKANKTYVDGEIAKAQLEGAGVDTSQFVTQDDLINVSDSIGDLEELQVDGKNVVEAINNSLGSGGGLSQSAKDALINCFNHVAWIDGNGASYVATLQTALNASTTAKVASISAVYSGGSVASGSDLSALKENLVVTATYDDGTEVAVTGYTLSGIIAEGENTITVSYRKVTTTFTVTGLASYTITYNLTNVTSSSDVLAVVTGEYYTTTFSYDSSLYDLQSVTVIMGDVDVTNEVYGDGTILIAEVTGDIVITAIASQPVLNSAVLLTAGNDVKYYSSSDATTLLKNQLYSDYVLIPDVATLDSVAKITITNNTGATVGANAEIYAGQTNQYSNSHGVVVYDSVLAYTISSLGIENGNSITFTANIEKGYNLIFTGIKDCDIEVKNIITDPIYDTDTYTEYSKTNYQAGGSLQWYEDDGSSTPKNYYYGQYYVTDDVFEEDTEVMVVVKSLVAEQINTDFYMGSMLTEQIGLGTAKGFYCSAAPFNKISQYANCTLTYTVKAGHHLACSYIDETKIEITFKTKN